MHLSSQMHVMHANLWKRAAGVMQRAIAGHLLDELDLNLTDGKQHAAVLQRRKESAMPAAPESITCPED